MAQRWPRLTVHADRTAKPFSSSRINKLPSNFALCVRYRMRRVMVVLALLLAFAIAPGLTLRLYPYDIRLRPHGD